MLASPGRGHHTHTTRVHRSSQECVRRLCLSLSGFGLRAAGRCSPCCCHSHQLLVIFSRCQVHHHHPPLEEHRKHPSSLTFPQPPPTPTCTLTPTHPQLQPSPPPPPNCTHTYPPTHPPAPHPLPPSQGTLVRASSRPVRARPPLLGSSAASGRTPGAWSSHPHSCGDEAGARAGR